MKNIDKPVSRSSNSMTGQRSEKLKILLLSLCVPLSVSNAFCQNLDIYVSDAGNFNNPPWQILKFDENGDNPEVFITENLGWPQDILFLEDAGTVLISNFITGRIDRYNAETGEHIDIFASGISEPTRMKIGADNLLYVLQWSGNGKVRRYQLDGTFVDEFTNAGVDQSIGIDWDSAGNLYISSFNRRQVQKFDPNGNDLGIFVNTTNLLGPTNIWFDDSGDLLVSDYNGTAVKRFDSDGNYLGDFIQGLSKSEGVDFLPNGNILIGNGATSSVKMYDSDGTYIEDLVPSGSGNLLTPNAVIVRQLDTGTDFQINAGLNGNWWNGLARNGEGVQIEVSDGGDGSLILVATIYSYNTVGRQIFLIAVGTVNGGKVEVDVFITDGGLWGDNFDPMLVNETKWGTGTFTAGSCDAMNMALMPNAEFQGVGYTNLMYGLVRLTTPAAPCPIGSPGSEPAR
jgi:hypothetical protein